MTGQDAINIVREYFPGVSDELAGAILWEYTGWPAFWDGDPEMCMRKQLQELRDTRASQTSDNERP